MPCSSAPSAYQEAGLTESGEPLPPGVSRQRRRAHRRGRPRQSRASGHRGDASAPCARPTAIEQAAGTRSSIWFGGVIVAGCQPPRHRTPAPPTTPRSRHPTVATAAHPRLATLERLDEQHRGAQQSPPPAAAACARRAEPRAAAKPEGKFRVQVAMVRTQDEAQAVAAKVKRDHAAALAAREPEIDQAVVGNMGSFYRVRVGPFATQQEGQAAAPS